MTDQRDLNQLFAMIQNRFDDVRESIDKLAAKVDITNGRVTKLETDRVARAAAEEVRVQMTAQGAAKRSSRTVVLVTIGAAAVTSLASVVASLVAHYIK